MNTDMESLSLTSTDSLNEESASVDPVDPDLGVSVIYCWGVFCWILRKGGVQVV